MTDPIASILEHIIAEIEDSSIKNQLASALQACIEKQQCSIEELLTAKKNGQLTEEEFQAELEREKLITHAEMLTWQITAKAEVQKVVNKTFQALADLLV
ncbi:hypothetical protein ElyMa_003801600 [Elysia marginata]|uniref:Uncharacterized protein n=1 Tax=Elysia marginata TaxID=1093978 RepID=A0AAV4FCR6_9GAST|nr:hypothetical protein ElyMa_003801600 [Elysia marginata]